MDTLSGLVTRLQSGFFSVQTEQGVFTCRLRGRLKRGPAAGDIATIGDRVKIRAFADGSGVIEAVEPRRCALIRMAPTPRGEYCQVLVANPDQVALVFACAEPAPRLRMLDRFLVICEKQGIPALIVANKIDLVGLERAQELFSIYPSLGYRVIYTSALTGEGIEELRRELLGRLSGLAGPSGVGKTSLLNVLQPGLGLEVRAVNQARGKGRHTTQVRALFALDGGGYLADLPGLRTLTLWDTTPEELDGYFPELRPLVADCQFSDCTHRNEPGCAVRVAVAEGRVHPQRYESYLRLRAGDES